MSTSRKHYWLQTLKLTGITFAVVLAEILGVYIAGVNLNDAPVLDIVAGFMLIYFAVVMYKGYGFFRGWGGLIVARLAVFVLSFCIGFIVAVAVHVTR